MNQNDMTLIELTEMMKNKHNKKIYEKIYEKNRQINMIKNNEEQMFSKIKNNIILEGNERIKHVINNGDQTNIDKNVNDLTYFIMFGNI